MEQSSPPVAERRSLGLLRQLSPRMAAFVVADVVLLLVFFIVLALALSGGLGGGAASTGSPASAATSAAPAASAPSSTGAAAGKSTTFALPSGNIACEVSADAATCTIANSTAKPPVDASCSGVIGVELTVTADGADMPCVEGAAPGAAAEGTTTLEYGQSETVGDFTCTSSSTGVMCKHDPSGKGFRLARAGSELF